MFPGTHSKCGNQDQNLGIWLQRIYWVPLHATVPWGGHPEDLKWYFSAMQPRGRTAADGAGLQKQKEFQHTGVMEKYDWKRDG